MHLNCECKTNNDIMLELFLQQLCLSSRRLTSQLPTRLITYHTSHPLCTVTNAERKAENHHTAIVFSWPHGIISRDYFLCVLNCWPLSRCLTVLQVADVGSASVRPWGNATATQGPGEAFTYLLFWPVTSTAQKREGKRGGSLTVCFHCSLIQMIFALRPLGNSLGHSPNRHTLPVCVSAEWWETGSHRPHQHCLLCVAMCLLHCQTRNNKEEPQVI